MDPLIVLFLLSLINPLICLPKLCTKDGKPITSFKTLTKLVNDSYLIVNHLNEYSVFEESPDVFMKVSDLKSKSNNRFKTLKFDNLFIMDVDQLCTNVMEEIYVIESNKESKGTSPNPNSYTIYTDSQWDDIREVVQSEILRGLQENSEVDIYRSKKLVFVFFEANGLLVFDPLEPAKAAFAQCSDKGWTYSKSALKYDTSFHSSAKIDIGYVDNDEENDEKYIIFFELEDIGSDLTHYRNSFYKCGYKLKANSVYLKNCQKKNFDTFCETDELLIELSDQLIQKAAMSAFLLLVILCAIVIIIIACLCCQSMPKLPGKKSSAKPSSTSFGAKDKDKKLDTLSTNMKPSSQ